MSIHLFDGCTVLCLSSVGIIFYKYYVEYCLSSVLSVSVLFGFLFWCVSDRMDFSIFSGMISKK